MTAAEYRAHIDSALQGAERMRTYCNGDEIIFIMRPEFYRNILIYAPMAPTFTVGRELATLHGYPIALINECDEDTVIAPAITNLTHYNDMEEGDFAVEIDVDQLNGQVFRLVRRTPAWFANTDMTVRFTLANPTLTATAAADAITTNVATADTAIPTNIATATTGYTYTWHDAGTAVNVDGYATTTTNTPITEWGRDYLLRYVNGDGIYTAPGEDELPVGDDRAIDEFLKGFTIKEARK